MPQTPIINSEIRATLSMEELAMQKGLLSVLQSVSRKYYELKLEEDPSEVSSNPRFLQMASYIKKHQRSEDEEGDRSTWLFMTVNPKPGITVEKFKSLVDKAVHKKWVKSFAYVFEWRNDLGDGLHSHMLIHKARNKRPSEIRREMESTFTSVIGTPKHINYKFVYSNAALVARYKYLYGEKKPEKMAQVDYDWQLRDKYGLEPIYLSYGFEETVSTYFKEEECLSSQRACVSPAPPLSANKSGGEGLERAQVPDQIVLDMEILKNTDISE